MADFFRLDDADLQGKKVILRVDFNVATDKEGNITDDTRIKAAIPTIKYLQEHGAKTILLSHLGRPDGKRVDSLKLDKVAHRLSELIHREVRKVDDCIGVEAQMVIATLTQRDVLMLENIRFHKEEEDNDFGFARDIARLGDIYVNDALSASHRAHTSVSAIAAILPSYAGPSLQKEVAYFEKLIHHPDKPFIIVIGGAKISDKIGVIKNLLPKADYILVGGATANTLLASRGFDMKSSLVEKEKVDLGTRLLELGAQKLVIPLDVVCSSDSGVVTVDVSALQDGMAAKDIGPKTVELFKQKIRGARTILFAGPLGLFEDDNFANGTREVLKVIVATSNLRVAGGGDSLAAINKFKLSDNFSFLSTSGGAMLEFLEGKKLPGVKALEDAKKRLS